MFGHGTFIHQPDYAIAAFGSPAAVVAAMRDMGMAHAWLRVHGRDGAWRIAANRRLAEALGSAGIAVGVWGWCDGNDVARDIANAREAIEAFAPAAYIADIEPGVGGARWTPGDARRFAEEVKARLGSRPLVVSSAGLLTRGAPEVMAAMEPAVDAFAPQAYWFDGPDGATARTEGVRPNDPLTFAELCIRQWRQVVNRPLVLTGQAWWGEVAGWTQARAETRLAAFLAGFVGDADLAGLNWWNLAAPDAMSPRMRAAIAAARLDRRFPQAPIPR